MKNYYNLHGLLSFSIEGPKDKLDYINRQYCYFRSEEPLEAVDIEVTVGRVPEISAPYDIVNRMYMVNRRQIYAKDAYKVARWEFMIEGLEDERTKVYFDGNFWSYYILYKFFIEPLIRFKLNAKGFFMIHSSSVSTDKGALVFPASPSVGKTSTMLNWLHGGMGFIADEFTILNGRDVYSYPTPLRLHDYNLTANPFVKKDMSAGDKFQIYLRTWIFRLTFGYGDITHEVNIWNVFRDVNIVDRAFLNAIIVFTKTSLDDVAVEELSARELVDRLVIINRFETSRFTDYLQAYEYAMNTEPEKRFWNLMRENGMRTFTAERYYAFKIPRRYTDKTFRQINERIAQLTNNAGKSHIGGGYIGLNILILVKIRNNLRRNLDCLSVRPHSFASERSRRPREGRRTA